MRPCLVELPTCKNPLTWSRLAHWPGSSTSLSYRQRKSISAWSSSVRCRPQKSLYFCHYWMWTTALLGFGNYMQSIDKFCKISNKIFPHVRRVIMPNNAWRSNTNIMTHAPFRFMICGSSASKSHASGSQKDGKQTKLVNMSLHNSVRKFKRCTVVAGTREAANTNSKAEADRVGGATSVPSSELRAPNANTLVLQVVHGRTRNNSHTFFRRQRLRYRGRRLKRRIMHKLVHVQIQKLTINIVGPT